MDKKRDILEREDLRRNPYSVPEGYFDQLQQRLGAIPRQAAAERKEFAAVSAENASVQVTRNRILPALAWAAGVAAMLAAGVFVFRGNTGIDPGMSEVLSYEQLAYADLIPRTDPYIYYAEEETTTPADPEEEEMIDYLLQSRIFDP